MRIGLGMDRFRAVACALRFSPRILTIALAFSSCASCTPDVDGTWGTDRAPLIYGADDRKDVWAEPDSDLRALARATSVALIAPPSLRYVSDSRVEVRAAPLSAWDSYCDGTGFLDQPTAAVCSGSLIDDDLVLTAGHCLDTVPSCRDYAYVFSYSYASAGQLGPIRREDVFSCRQVVVKEVSPPDSDEQVDFAIVQLDRNVGANRPPASVSTDAPLTAGTKATVVGLPLGLPTKIDSGAAVVDPHDALVDRFTLTSDTFRGSSGSGVFLASRALAGVFAKGTADFVDHGDCRAERTVPQGTASSGESATYAARAIASLCATGWPSSSLCATAPRCGDGVCSPKSEDAASCPADCPAPDCGDELCETSECATCPADCGDRRPTGTPDGWYCEIEWYADGGHCDCDCGAPDPDCANRACDTSGPGGAAPRTLDVAASGGCAVSSHGKSVPQRNAASFALSFACCVRRRRERPKK